MISQSHFSPHLHPPPIKAKITRIYVALLVFNIATWSWAVVLFGRNSVLWGTAFLAYSFGLRHAVDADHIAAIDNVTRRMMQDENQPIAVGLMFSLGHSSVVVVGSIVVALTASAMQHQFEAVRQIGQLVGTLVSTIFLFGIAISNLIVLRSIYRAFRRVRRGEPSLEGDRDSLSADRGLLCRLLRPILGSVHRGWHMYPLGFLFGLGFDTATEIGLLGISAAQGSRNLPLWSILVFPLLFAAGMSLIDTTDNLLMLGAYGWAFAKPIRKLYYNMTITSVSVLIALMVGTAEAMGLLAARFQLTGGFWNLVVILNENYVLVGYCIIAFFVLSWGASVLIYKWRRFGEISFD